MLDSIYFKVFAVIGISYGFYLAAMTVSTMDPLHMGGENKEGYWGEKTSSVNFCEIDYQWTPYVAELWNMLSSFIIVLFPIIGLLYSNPTQEKRFTLGYIILGIVGSGSVALHTFLTKESQAMDEVPMLWMTTSLLYCIVDSKQGTSSSLFASISFIISLVLTYTYMHVASFYHIFVGVYLSMVLFILISLARMLWNDKGIKKKLFMMGLFAYVIVGSSVWVLDMFLCKELSFLYIGGITLHPLWHLAAGYATYSTVSLLIAHRIDELQLGTPTVAWILYIVPLISIEKKGKKAAANTASPGTRKSARKVKESPADPGGVGKSSRSRSRGRRAKK